MKLKLDNNFIPSPESDGDELYRIGMFVFNITKMKEHIKDNPEVFVTEDVGVKDLRYFSSLNESHVDSIDLTKPVILAEIAPSRFKLIDGQHRVEKAHRMGIDSLLAYKLDVHQHIRFLTSKKAYESYVEYWNSKLRELE